MINLTDEELYEESMKDIDPRTLELMNLKFENLNLKEQQEKDKKLILLLLNALGVAYYGGGGEFQEEIPLRALGVAKFMGYTRTKNYVDLFEEELKNERD